MSRAKPAPDGLLPSSDDIEALGAFFASLAERVRADTTFAAAMLSVLRESGMIEGARRPKATSPSRARTVAAQNGRSDSGALDPFALLRERGEAGLSEALSGQELAGLRHIIRTYHLDPARISARWTARERLQRLIVDQVRARVNHGRAFERI